MVVTVFLTDDSGVGGVGVGGVLLDAEGGGVLFRWRTGVWRRRLPGAACWETGLGGLKGKRNHWGVLSHLGDRCGRNVESEER